jgi:hypothetical protein
VLKSSLAVSHVNIKLKTNIPLISLVSIIRVEVFMSTLTPAMETKEIFDLSSILTQVIVWKLLAQKYPFFIQNTISFIVPITIGSS